jgi:hypothetical protein
MRSPCCLCVYVSIYLPIVARQRLGKHVPTAMNTHVTIEELLDAVFSVPSVSQHVICRENEKYATLLEDSCNYPDIIVGHERARNILFQCIVRNFLALAF